MTTAAKPRRRWLRFSLRTMLLVITLLCVWLGPKIIVARRQHEAVEAILKTGGEVEFDYQMVPSGIEPDEFGYKSGADVLPPGPAWLRKIIGDEFFCDVVRVTLKGRIIHESDFAQLAKLPRLREVWLVGNTQIELNDAGIQRPLEDADLHVLQDLSQLRVLGIYPVDGQRMPNIKGPRFANLIGLKHLRRLDLDNTNFDDKGMQHIGKLTALKSLSLDNTRITDAGLAQLENLSNLELLDLNGTNITDAGLLHLQHLNNLKYLCLHRTKVTGAGLRFLHSKRLELLGLNDTPFNDEGMEQIGKNSNFQYLNLYLCGTLITDAGLKHVQDVKFAALYLNNTQITDAGLRYLYGFGQLMHLDLEHTRATADGIRELQKSLPTTRIEGP